MLTIPVDPRLPAQRFAVTLDDTRYVIHLRWRERMQGWYLDLHNSADEPIVRGRRLTPGGWVLRGLVDDRRPPGGLFVYAADGLDTLGPTDLGDRARLVYMTPTDIAGMVP